MNADLNEQAIDERVKALFPFTCMVTREYERHYAGCRRHHLYVVEDCAQRIWPALTVALSRSSRHATFSFYPGKNLGAYGDAGAIVTDNDDLAPGCTNSKPRQNGQINHEFEGVNSRMDNASRHPLPSSGICTVDGQRRPRRPYASYSPHRGHSGSHVDALQSCGPPVRHPCRHRDALMKHLKEAVFPRGSLSPSGFVLRPMNTWGTSRPTSPYATATRTIAELPIFAEITDEQMEYVCTQIRRLWRIVAPGRP
jgi:dTDP-4-amino-4,6-dideoxygalactose transaminase